MFQERHDLANHPELEERFLNYRKTSAVFSLIGVALMVLGLVSGIYCLREHRYMFKRLTSALFLMSAIANLVTIEVLMSSLTYAASHLPQRIPNGAWLRYGHSFYLHWIVFLINIIGGVVFLVHSRKKKGAMAAREEVPLDDEAVVLGR